MQAILFFNGCFLLLFGALLGFPYWISLKRDSSSAPAWRVAHSAITAGAVGMLAIAANFSLLNKLPAYGEQAIVLGSLISAYGFGIASTLSAITGHRGLSHGGAASNKITLFFNILGAFGSAVVGPLLVYGAYMNL